MASDSLNLQAISPRGGVRLRTADGRQLRLHSAKDPVGEAERWMRESGERLPGAFIVIGFGEGYVLDALARLGSGVPVIALEPDADVATAWRTGEHAAASAGSGAAKTVRLLVGPDYAGADQAWRDLTEDARVLIHPVYARERAADVERATRVAAKMMFDVQANADARRRLEGIYRRHTWQNVPSIVAGGDVRTLFDKFHGTPALLVGAGPSLDAVLHELPPLRERALIVAADTALRPLLAAGIEPHLVIAADPSELNGRHLRDLPALPDTWLVAEPSVHPAAFRPFAGRTYTFRIAAHDPWSRLHARGLDRGFLHIWGSVLTAAFDLALRLGCGPIAFVGSDLAFTGARPYCRNTIYDESWAARVASRDDLPAVFRQAIDRWPHLEAPDIENRPVRTAPHLVAFRDWIVAHAARHGDRAVFNATRGGILHGEGIIQTHVDALVREWPPSTSIMPTLEACAAVGATATRLDDQAALLEEAAREGGELLEGPPVASWTRVTPWALTERVAVLDTIVRGVALPRWLTASTSASTRWLHASALGPAPSLDALAETLAGIVSVKREPPVVEDVRPETGSTSEPGPAIALRPAQAGYWARDAEEAALRLERWTLDAAVTVGDKLATAAAVPELADGLDPVLLALLRGAWLRANVIPGGSEALHLLKLLRGFVPRLEATAPLPENDDILLTADIGVAPGLEAPGVQTRVRLSTRLPSAAALAPCTGAIVREDRDGREPSEGTFHGVSGVIVRIDARYADGRASRLTRPATAWATPVVLGRKRVTFNVARITPLNDDQAIVTLWGGDRSLAVDERGNLAPLAPWPHAISGEVRLGDGSQLAWTNGAPTRFCFRASDDGPVHETEVPFQTSRLAPIEDGAVLAAAVGGGLWRWDRREGAVRIADVPSGILVRADTQAAWIEDVRRTPDGRTVRTLDGRRSEVTLSTGHVSQTPVTSLGACWGVAERDGWKACVYPHADTVVIEHAEAGRFSLLCGYPNGIGWAGRTLLVGTAHGRVYIFHNLAEVLLACGRA